MFLGRALCDRHDVALADAAREGVRCGSRIQRRPVDGGKDRSVAGAVATGRATAQRRDNKEAVLLGFFREDVVITFEGCVLIGPASVEGTKMRYGCGSFASAWT